MRRSIPLVALCAAALLAPAAASAQTPDSTVIDGSPLNTYVNPDGGLNFSVDGYTVSEWYPPGSSDPNSGDPIPSPNGNAGFGLIIDPANGGFQRFGKQVGTVPQPPTAGPTLTPGNPTTVSTTWTMTESDPSSGAQVPLVQVTQLISYMNGSRQADATYSVHNVSSRALTFRANVSGDLAIRGSDQGIGFLTPGPPRFMGGLNQEVGAAGGFVEETPWSKYASGGLGPIGSEANDATEAGGFDNTLSTDPTDNAAGVQWDDHYSNALAAGDTATYQVGWKFIDTLGLTPQSSQKLTGDTATLTATVGDLNGNNAGDRTLDYNVSGSNNISGTVKTGADGKATLSYVGGAPGHDEIVVFTDLNGNKQRDDNEPQAKATIDWDGPPAPVIGVSAGVRATKGTVKIKFPPGFSAKHAKQTDACSSGASSSGFVRLTRACQVPMGSTLDTTHGTVNLLSAASNNSFQGKFQSGNFNGSQFRVTQTRKSPLTQLSMRGGGLSGCSTLVPKGGSAARKRHRRLFSSVKGRFRTRGRNSSATVRGTKFSMTDTCKGTTTVVTKGVVTVRNFTLKKNVTVRAGHKYFAKAPKKRSKNHLRK